MAQLSATTAPEGVRTPWPANDARARGAGERREQRRYRRLALALPVTLRNALGELCPASLVDVSPAGLRVRCDETTARRIHPAALRPEPGREPILQVTLELPTAAGPERLSLGVRLVHFALRPGPAGCVLGFDYLALRPRARRIVEAFFADAPKAPVAVRRRLG